MRHFGHTSSRTGRAFLVLGSFLIGALACGSFGEISKSSDDLIRLVEKTREALVEVPDEEVEMGPWVGPYLGTGWSGPERLPGGGFARWSDGPYSEVYLPMVPLADAWFSFRARGYVQPGGTVQKVTVSLNGTAIGEFALSRHFFEYRLQLPTDLLQDKDNVIRFQCRYTGPDENQQRDLGIYLNRFSYPSLTHGVERFGGVSAKSLLLKVPSRVRFPVLPEDSILSLRLAWRQYEEKEEEHEVRIRIFSIQSGRGRELEDVNIEVSRTYEESQAWVTLRVPVPGGGLEDQVEIRADWPGKSPGSKNLNGRLVMGSPVLYSENAGGGDLIALALAEKLSADSLSTFGHPFATDSNLLRFSRRSIVWSKGQALAGTAKGAARKLLGEGFTETDGTRHYSELLESVRDSHLAVAFGGPVAEAGDGCDLRFHARWSKEGQSLFLAYRQDNPDVPLFAVVHLGQPPPPGQSPPPELQKIRTRRMKRGQKLENGDGRNHSSVKSPLSPFDARVRAFDRALGSFLGSLSRLDPDEESVVIISSLIGLQSPGESKRVIRQGRPDRTDLAVPILIRAPAERFAGSSSDRTRSLIDLGAMIDNGNQDDMPPDFADGRVRTGKNRFVSTGGRDDRGHWVYISDGRYFFYRLQNQELSGGRIPPPRRWLFDGFADPAERYNIFGRKQALSLMFDQRAAELVTSSAAGS